MEWEFEPGHTSAAFRCRHMRVTWVQGHFREVRGRVVFDPTDPSGAFTEAEILAATLCTGNAERDEHLLGPDFLEAAQHPAIRFRSRAVELSSPTEWRVEGDLTLRGVTRPVALSVRYFGQSVTPYWEDGVDQGPVLRAGFTATASIDRFDFGVRWNSLLPDGGPIVGREVLLTIDVEALRRKEPG